jgi:hypothetical protein
MCVITTIAAADCVASVLADTELFKTLKEILSSN